jgi:hypothetical protein
LLQLLELVGQISDNDAKLAPVLIELQVFKTLARHILYQMFMRLSQAAAASVRPSIAPPALTAVDSEDCDT